MALKKRKSKNKVWVFIGDMTYETGVFHETYKYAKNHKLPIKFVVEDNNMSTNTPTNKVWIKKSKKRKRYFFIFLQKKISTSWNWNMGIILMTYKKN